MAVSFIGGGNRSFPEKTTDPSQELICIVHLECYIFREIFSEKNHLLNYKMVIQV